MCRGCTGPVSYEVQLRSTTVQIAKMIDIKKFGRNHGRPFNFFNVKIIAAGFFTAKTIVAEKIPAGFYVQEKSGNFFPEFFKNNQNYDGSPPRGLSGTSNPEGIRRENNHQVLQGTAGQITGNPKFQDFSSSCSAAGAPCRGRRHLSYRGYGGLNPH
jgi:hypothetical protein